MEYAKKCQTCEHLQTVFCYGLRKHQRTGYCIHKINEFRRIWVKNLPPGDSIGTSISDSPIKYSV
jgi:hypothetical protein